MGDERTVRTAPAGTGATRGLAILASAVLLLWLWVTLPLALGQRTLYFRDVFITHMPWKAFGAAELRQGRIPALNPTWSLGQPFRGDPNTLAFYPGNVLYLALPFWSAFNLHYALHWLLAALTMAALARALGQSPAAALVAALTYAGSGWVLTGLSFYNIIAVSAWWPLVLVGALRGGRRGIALGGLACGMSLLGGEPVTAGLGMVPLGIAAVERHGFRRGAGQALGIGATGLLIALPQLVATARVLEFTVRSTLGAVSQGAPRFHLGSARLLELIIPFPFGFPWDRGAGGYWPWDDQKGLPYVLTLHLGVVGLWLALLAVRRARSWALLAAAGIVLAWAGRFGGDLLAAVSGGLLRYPEKLLFWFALAAALLAGWGLERALESPGSWRGPAAGAGLALVLMGGIFLAGPRLAAWLEAGRVAPGFAGAGARGRIGLWLLALLMAAAFLACAALAARRRSATGLAAAQCLSLLAAGGLVMTAPLSDFAPSPWTRALGRGAGVVFASSPEPSEPTYLSIVRAAAQDLAPAPGVLYGLEYPLAPDLDGIYSPLFVPALATRASHGPGLISLWQAVGARAVVLSRPFDSPRLRLAGTRDQPGGPSVFYTVQDPAPAAWWPRAVLAAADAGDALRKVRASPDLVGGAVAFRPVVHHPGAKVRLVENSSDTIEIEVVGAGGLLVLRRAFQPLYQASSGGRSLPIQPVNLVLMGVEVPPGSHRVRVEASSGPEKLAGGIAAAAFLGALALAWRR